jgi:hypothetical protein
MHVIIRSYISSKLCTFNNIFLTVSHASLQIHDDWNISRKLQRENRWEKRNLIATTRPFPSVFLICFFYWLGEVTAAEILVLGINESAKQFRNSFQSSHIKGKRALLSLWNDILGTFLNVVKIAENTFYVQDMWPGRNNMQKYFDVRFAR